MISDIDLGIKVAWSVAALAALTQAKLGPYMSLLLKQFGVLVGPASPLLSIASVTVAGVFLGLAMGVNNVRLGK